MSVEELKQTAVNLCIELINSEVDLSEVVPHAAFSSLGKALSVYSHEDLVRELTGMVNRMESEIPEEKREEVLTNFVEHLQCLNHDLKFTKKRIDHRIQPEGQERVSPTFHSFCKRKKTDW